MTPVSFLNHDSAPINNLSQIIFLFIFNVLYWWSWLFFHKLFSLIFWVWSNNFYFISRKLSKPFSNNMASKGSLNNGCSLLILMKILIIKLLFKLLKFWLIKLFKKIRILFTMIIRIFYFLKFVCNCRNQNFIKSMNSSWRNSSRRISFLLRDEVTRTV